MKLFNNEKLSKVNERISELESKREALQGEVNEILQAVSDSIEAYAKMEVDEATVQKAKEILEAKTKEIGELDEMISRVKGVRKSVALESIPFVKEARSKRVEAINKESFEAEIELKKAIAEVFLCHNKISKIRSKASNLNNSYEGTLTELGEKNVIRLGGSSLAFKSFEDLALNPNPSYFGEEEASKMMISFPDWAAGRAIKGYLPQWVQHYQETGEIKLQGK